MAIEKTDEALVMKQREIMEEINHLPHGGKKSLIYTLGCQQNESDSEKLSGMLKKMGYTPTENPEEADVILFNTCAVRENAEKKLFGRVGALKPLKEKNPELLLGVCGCMAQEAGMEEKFRRRYRFVDMVFGTHALYRFPEILKKALSERTQVRDVSDIDGEVTEGIPVDRASSVKSYVSVMYGCNNFCSYCIGFLMSASIRTVFLPSSAKEMPRFTATVVFPVSGHGLVTENHFLSLSFKM